MQPGDMVTYAHLHRGGYGYETRHPARVVKVHGTKQATIRVARIDRQTPEEPAYKPVEVRVSQARLTPRNTECAFENVLTETRG